MGPYRGGGRSTRTLTGAAVVSLVLSAAAVAANPRFPSTEPNESVRLKTPDDPAFDRCEPHEPGEGQQTCTNTFDQEFERFGFAPLATDDTATYKNPSDPHVQRLMDQNTLAKRNSLGQVPGVSADRAWKFSAGSPDVQVAIVDTGVEWNASDLRTKVKLNAGELPEPLHDRLTPLSDGAVCAGYANADDANGDGAFSVLDYVCDSRVQRNSGPNGSTTLLDGQDLIFAFRNGVDDDGNGYADDIAGWDFFDDDEDPFDASSYSTAEGHGTGRAEEAAAATNNGNGGTGVCPRCQYVPLRAWDSFVLDTNNFGQAVTYAADNGIEVVEGAIGGLYNSRFNREAFEYGYARGVFFTIVSSDANTASHNFPTVYNETLMIAGVVADQHGLGYSDQGYPEAFIDFVTPFGLQPPANAPVATWFRNSGLTQYGGHAGIVMPATSGSEGTGQASGAAALLNSYGRQRAAGGQLTGGPLEPNEIKQLLTLTAEDVVPENTVGSGVPDPAQVGWDQHFGYGKPDLGLAMEWIRDSKIPPQVMITSPDWFSPLNVARQTSVEIRGRLSAHRAAGYSWKLQWAPGIEPCESDFRDVAPAQARTTPLDGTLGTIDLTAVRAALDARRAQGTDPACRQAPGPVTGGSTIDPTAPQKGPGDRDPNEPAFTVRVVSSDSGNRTGEHRKTLFAYRDSTVHDGWSKNMGTGGEASQRLYDLNGDNALDIVQAESSGELRVLNADGSPLQSFNGGQPVRTQVYANVHAAAPAYSVIDAPRGVLRTPVIGDIDGDMEPEIVASAGEHVYAWNADGTQTAGFPVRLDPSKSLPADRTHGNHVKRGFHAAPTLGDLTGDGALEIAIPGMDQHLYAWDGRGAPLPGFPVLLRKPGDKPEVPDEDDPEPNHVPGAEAVTTAAIGDIAGDARPEIVTPTNELATATTPVPELQPGVGRIYAVRADGTFVPGWPAEPTGQLPGLIPFFGPSAENALANVDGAGKLEAIGALTSADVKAYGEDGEEKVGYVPEPVASTETVNRSLIVNTFEYPTVANLNGGDTLEVLKGGITIEGVANLLAVGQNIPFNHVMQAWDADSGNPVPGWPQVVEDYQWMSNPAVADVSSAPGHEVLAPNGLYMIRNLNAQGLEGTGWPKFTGGWNEATPAVGDADGDGKLEVAALSREGNAFLWDSDQPACGTNDQWWTSRHDEWNSGTYGTDSRPPGTPRAVRAAREGNSVAIAWTSPGDDWLCGAPTRFRVVRSPDPIEHPAAATVVATIDVTKQTGEGEGRTFADVPAGEHIGILYQDDRGNWGHVASTTTPESPAPVCSDLGPLPVPRNESRTVELTCLDAGGDPLTLSVVDQPQHGTLGPIDPATGRVVYTPSADYSGPDSFTYRASDGTNESGAATVQLVVAGPGNRAPSCDERGPIAVPHGTATQIALSCSDADGDTLALTVASNPEKGKLGPVDQSRDSVEYTPNPGARGADEFTYRANDAAADSPAARVSLEIGAPRGPDATGCASAITFRSVGVRPRGRGLSFAFATAAGGPASVALFKLTRPNGAIRSRRAANFGSRARPFVWSGRRPRVGDGYYTVRFRTRAANGQSGDRLVGLRRARGRWRVLPAFHRPAPCASVNYFSLARPVFGGIRARPLTVAFGLARPARVEVIVRRGSKVVKTFRARRYAAARKHRLLLRARRLAPGRYTVDLRASAPQNGKPIRRRGHARKL